MKAETKSKHSIAEELHNLRKNRIYLTMMALLLVGAVIWVLVSLMGAKTETEVSTKAAALATPVNPNLDTAVFAILESKRLYTTEELEAFPINRLIKDRSGGYTVIPFDTPRAEVEALTTGTVSTPAPTPVTTPLPTVAPAATGASTLTL